VIQATPLSRIKLLAFDVDGTLVPKDHEVSPGNIAAIERARDSGLTVVIATGRRFRTTLRIISQLPEPVPAVVLGGSLVKDARGETLASHTISPSDLGEVIELARSCGQTVIAQSDGSMEDSTDFTIDARSNWNAQTHRYFEENGEWGRRSESLSSDPPADVLVVGCFGNQSSAEDLARAVSARFEDRLATHTLPGPGLADSWYCEIRPARTSKWTGLVQLANHLGISRDGICAVGDEVNDIPMFRGAAYSVAMGDARPEVLAEADWVTTSCQEDGVARWIDRLLAARAS
jgi:Cof subfamily protein (haloacid dehalogenase superfamily)